MTMQKAPFSKPFVAASLLLFSLAGSCADSPGEEPDAETTTVAIGGGVEHQPGWLGAATHKTHAIPYLDINWHDQVELSTTGGFSADLLHRKQWHGGLVGTLIWGRSARDLVGLANRVNTLNNTIQAGAYLEYAFTKTLNVGTRWRHDIQDTGAAYADVYGELDLPAPGPLEHSIKLDAEVMNRSAMRRFFGVSPEVGANLGTSAYQPNAGLARISATYQLFVPTSQHTALVFAIDWSRLQGSASRSPLVRDFGSRNQRDFMLAAIYHF